ncbi:ABC transporter permease [Micromonospora sp. DT228]|uniref:ABC transporter permease n=1 Tax=Micromonospora sp. DT228 TaxID=3393443 RepID=UPI003CEEE9BA
MLGSVARRLALVLIAAGFGYLLAASALHPRAAYDAMQPKPPESTITMALNEANLNPADPKLVRLGRWAKGIVTDFDFGRTIDGQSINAEIGRRVWSSVRLLVVASVIGSVLGVLTGAYSATRHNRWSDNAITFVSIVVLSVPVFVLAVAMKQPAIAFNDAVGTPVLLLQGEYDVGGGGWGWDAIVDRARHLVVPTVSLALGMVALFSRYQRATMLDVLDGEFLRTARAKGLHRRQALIRHGLRVAVIPMVTLFSYHFAAMFVGTIFTEKIFGWHGMGEFFIDSVNKNDINSVATVVLFSAVLVLAAGAIADLAHAVLDPRVRGVRWSK